MVPEAPLPSLVLTLHCASQSLHEYSKKEIYHHERCASPKSCTLSRNEMCNSNLLKQSKSNLE